MDRKFRSEVSCLYKKNINESVFSRLSKIGLLQHKYVTLKPESNGFGCPSKPGSGQRMYRNNLVRTWYSNPGRLGRTLVAASVHELHQIALAVN